MSEHRCPVCGEPCRCTFGACERFEPPLIQVGCFGLGPDDRWDAKCVTCSRASALHGLSCIHCQNCPLVPVVA